MKRIKGKDIEQCVKYLNYQGVDVEDLLYRWNDEELNAGLDEKLKGFSGTVMEKYETVEAASYYTMRIHERLSGIRKRELATIWMMLALLKSEDMEIKATDKDLYELRLSMAENTLHESALTLWLAERIVTRTR